MISQERARLMISCRFDNDNSHFAEAAWIEIFKRKWNDGKFYKLAIHEVMNLKNLLISEIIKGLPL